MVKLSSSIYTSLFVTDLRNWSSHIFFLNKTLSQQLRVVVVVVGVLTSIHSTDLIDNSYSYFSMCGYRFLLFQWVNRTMNTSFLSLHMVMISSLFLSLSAKYLSWKVEIMSKQCCSPPVGNLTAADVEGHQEWQWLMWAMVYKKSA